MQPVKTKKKLSRADKKQIEAAIARANRTDKKGKSAQDVYKRQLKNTMNAMQPPQSIEEIKAGLETTEKGGVRQSIRNLSLIHI